jgi:hypothetical protein
MLPPLPPVSGSPLQVLLLMKHVSRSGRAEFRRCLQKHAEAVKGCLRECV